MPFTFSHPAAAIPLARYGLVLSALVVGSMAPDFLYFIPGLDNRDFGHTRKGIFFVCIPLGLAVLWFFHAVLKRPLLALLPVGHQKRLQAWAGPFPFLPLGRLLRITVSLLVGVLTHIGWDFLTHSELFAHHPSPLRHLPVVGPLFSRLGIYMLLQYGSTVLGAGLILYWYWNWLRRTSAEGPPVSLTLSHFTRWFLMVSIPVGALSIGLLQVYLRMPRVPFQWRMLPNLLNILAITAVMAMALSFLIYALLWHLFSRMRSGEEEASLKPPSFRDTSPAS